MMQKSQRITLLLTALGIVIGVWYWWWFTNNFEKTEVFEYRAPETEGVSHDYLLAAELLRRKGHTVKLAPSFTDLPASPGRSDVVMLLAPVFSVAEDKVTALLDWSEQGGHLIVLAAGKWDEDTLTAEHPVLDAFSVRPERQADFFDFVIENIDGEAEEPGDVPLSGVSTSDHPVTRVDIDDSTALAVDFDADRHIIDTMDQAKWNAGGDYAHLLEFHHGRGLVTILADTAPLNDIRLAEYDHVRFLFELIKEHDDSATIWLQFRAAAAPWTQLLWQHAWPVLLLGLLWLLFWLWHHGQRLGPTLVASTDSRRSLLEHIRAAGLWQWENNRQPLIDAARKNCLTAIWDRYPGLKSLPDPAMHNRIAELLELESEAVSTALASEDIKDPAQFRQCMETLQKIESHTQWHQVRPSS